MALSMRNVGRVQSAKKQLVVEKYSWWQHLGEDAAPGGVPED